MAPQAGRGARLVKAVSRVTGRRSLPAPVLRAGHTVDLLEGGAAFFPALEAAIDAARRDVHLETYILHNDVAGRRIVAALARAAQRGVAVRLAVDGYGTPRVPSELLALLADGPVALRIFRPERGPLSWNRSRLRRLHRKLVVIDGELAFVGGINLLDDLIDPNHGALERPRLDFAVCVRGPLVRDAVEALGRVWHTLASGDDGPAVAARPRRHRLTVGASPSQPAAPAVAAARGAAPLSGLRAMLLLRDNFRFRRTIEHEYLAAIQAARREILIANAYFFPGARMRHALTAAARRGVRVTLLLQGRVEYRLQHYASQALYDELLGAGIAIVEYKASFLHAKVAVVDDWATVGSSNIDPFSLLLAREANVVIRDAGFADLLRTRIIAAIEGGGRRVLAQHHARRAWPVRVMNWFAVLVLRAGVAISGRAARY